MNALILSLLRQAHQQANTDPLTNLGTRRAAFSYLSQLASPAQPPFTVALLLVDLDHFKQVNDGFGHEVGDQVLHSTAARIAVCASARVDARTFRLGGEEFLIVARVDNADAARVLADNVRRSVGSVPIATDGGDLDQTVSVGVAFVTNTEDLAAYGMWAADDALYAAKRAGRNCVRFYERELAPTTAPQVRGASRRDPLPVLDFEVQVFSGDAMTVSAIRSVSAAAAAQAAIAESGVEECLAVVLGPSKAVRGAFLHRASASPDFLDLSEWCEALRHPSAAQAAAQGGL